MSQAGCVKFRKKLVETSVLLLNGIVIITRPVGITFMIKEKVSPQMLLNPLYSCPHLLILVFHPAFFTLLYSESEVQQPDGAQVLP